LLQHEQLRAAQSDGCFGRMGALAQEAHDASDRIEDPLRGGHCFGPHITFAATELQRRRMMSRVFCTLTVVVAMAGGCAHKQETKAEAPKSEPAPAPQAAATPAPPADKTCASDLDCGAKQLCINNRCVDITPDLAECTNVRVHFPFNSDEIDSADKPSL